MKLTFKIVLMTLCGVGFVIAQENRQEKAAEQVYKNIQVFKGLPASQLQPVMAFMSGSLGVKCSHCHTNPFEKDEKPAKQTARRMIRMVFEINKGNFSGANAVTCYTCHRGQPTPPTVPTVGQNLWQGAGAVDPKSAAALPTIEQLLDRYANALGSRPALTKVTTRVMKGSRVGADGVLVPEEVYQKAPNKLLVVTRYPTLLLRRGFDGKRGWGSENNEVTQISTEEEAELARDADLNKDFELRQLYSEMSVGGSMKLDERQVYLVEAKSRRGNHERLYFDAQTGLLVRRYREHQIALGLFPTQTDYDDYREVDGVKLPFSIRWSMPGRSWGRKITEVKHNTPLDDAIFSQASAKN